MSGETLKLQAKLRRLAIGRDKVAKSIGDAVLARVQAGFDSQSAPDGEPWKPKYDGGPALTNVRGTYSVEEATADRVKIGTSFPWAEVHAHGAEIKPVSARALSFSTAGVFSMHATLPPRPQLPSGRLPSDWSEDAARAAKAAMREALE